MARTYRSPQNNGHNGNYQNNIHVEPPHNPNNHPQNHRRNGPYLPKRNHQGGDHHYKPNNHNSQNHNHQNYDPNYHHRQYGRFHPHQNNPHNSSHYSQHHNSGDRALVIQEPAFSSHSTGYGKNALSNHLSRYHGPSRNCWVDVSQPMHESSLVAFDGTQRDTDGDLIMDEAPELRTFSFRDVSQFSNVQRQMLYNLGNTANLYGKHADMLLRGAQNMANCAADLQSLSAYINTVEQCFFPSFDQRSSVHYYG